MTQQRNSFLWRTCQALMVLIVLKTTVTVFVTLAEYFPPNFDSDFLSGRNEYFFGSYRLAFYPHVVAGPISLFLGMVLISDSIRIRFPKWHKRLGRVQVACVLLFVVPSGIWMSRYAETGAIAGLGFATLGVATGICVSVGWGAATRREFRRHRVWMMRCYMLLCSAVVLRLIGGFSNLVAADWTYPYAAWLSWILPLSAFEIINHYRRSLHYRQ